MLCSREQVNNHLVEIAVGEFFARVSALNTRAVDQDANLVAVGKDLGREGGDLLLHSHVGRVDPSLAAQRLDQVFGLGDAGVALGLELVSRAQLESRGKY